MKLPPFQSLLDAHREDVFRFLVASVGRDEAEDCFQETFMAALRSYPGLSDGSNLKGWLFTIAHRKAIDCHRRRRRAGVPHAELPETGEEREPETVDQSLWVRVRGLPPKQRSSIVLRYVEDLPYRTIGEVTGCSESAARQNVRAGLIKLREEFGT
ncbi:MAG: RNA polymerase sigma factor [Acidimicrobiia bacterium]|nr:RNA polymerase sigma factor [Acidimicrobiia bacterium]